MSLMLMIMGSLDKSSQLQMRLPCDLLCASLTLTHHWLLTLR